MNHHPLDTTAPSARLRLRFVKVVLCALAGLAIFAAPAQAQVNTSTGQSAITTVSCNTANHQIVIAPSMTTYWTSSGQSLPVYAKAWLYSYATRTYVYQSLWTTAAFQQGSSIVITPPSGYYGV